MVLQRQAELQLGTPTNVVPAECCGLPPPTFEAAPTSNDSIFQMPKSPAVWIGEAAGGPTHSLKCSGAPYFDVVAGGQA